MLRFARNHQLKVAPQGAGHQAASLRDLSGAILLRTDLLREIRVDIDTRTVRVGAGVLWGDVSWALAPHGLTARAGSSHGVGVVRCTLGGGYSWLTRRYGLAVSSVTAAELVTGDGKFHRVDRYTEPELFWAVRGAGATFGVVTALEFGVLPFDQIYGGAVMFPIARAPEVLQRWAEWTADVDDAATTAVRLLRLPPLPDLPDFLRGKSFAVVDGAIAAPEAEAVELLAPLRGLGPVVDTFRMMPTSGLDHLQHGPTTARAGRGRRVHHRRTHPIGDPGPAGCRRADRRQPLLAVDLRQLGGAAGRPDPNGGAVDHLPGRYLAFAVGTAGTPESARLVAEHVAAVREALRPWANGREYRGFREAPAPAGAFYPPDVLARLRAVRASHDPAGIIHANHGLDGFPHAIGLGGRSGWTVWVDSATASSAGQHGESSGGDGDGRIAAR
ncbi:MAG TPA: FAD-binding oxidoreductase, partial [Mycobacterium sp.]